MSGKVAQLRPCRDCEADIYLLRSVANPEKWMPVEEQPSAAGNIRIDVYRQTAEALSASSLTNARAEGEELHLAHHVNCPAAAEYRHKPKNGTPPLFDPDELEET